LLRNDCSPRSPRACKPNRTGASATSRELGPGEAARGTLPALAVELRVAQPFPLEIPGAQGAPKADHERVEFPRASAFVTRAEIKASARAAPHCVSTLQPLSCPGCGERKNRDQLGFDFTFAYQLIVDVRGRVIVAHEALVRGPQGRVSVFRVVPGSRRPTAMRSIRRAAWRPIGRGLPGHERGAVHRAVSSRRRYSQREATTLRRRAWRQHEARVAVRSAAASSYRGIDVEPSLSEVTLRERRGR
jgi:hypothetical protein